MSVYLGHVVLVTSPPWPAQRRLVATVVATEAARVAETTVVVTVVVIDGGGGGGGRDCEGGQGDDGVMVVVTEAEAAVICGGGRGNGCGATEARRAVSAPPARAHQSLLRACTGATLRGLINPMRDLAMRSLCKAFGGFLRC